MKWMAWICLWIVFLATVSEPNLVGDTSSISLLAVYPRLGFIVSKKQNHLMPTQWEKDRFGVISKNSVFIKSRFPSNLGKNSFYRFWIDEEYFNSEKDASHRLDSLYQMPPDFKGQRKKDFPLRRGFSRGAKVYIFRTDVSAYSEKLEQLTKGFELLEAITGIPEGKKVFDSLRTEIQRPN